MLTKLAQFGLPIWFFTSFSLLLWLPTPLLLQITPYVSAGLLSVVGGTLGLVLYQLHSGKHYRPKSFFGVLIAAILAQPVAIVFAYKLVALLSLYPLREMAALAWFLSSMGAALTVVVGRLMSDILMAQTTGSYESSADVSQTLMPRDCEI